MLILLLDFFIAMDLVFFVLIVVPLFDDFDSISKFLIDYPEFREVEK